MHRHGGPSAACGLGLVGAVGKDFLDEVHRLAGGEGGGMSADQLEVHEHNSRARRAYEKCGFTVEGRLREALLWQGRRYDTLLMFVLRTDPRPGR